MADLRKEELNKIGNVAISKIMREQFGLLLDLEGVALFRARQQKAQAAYISTMTAGMDKHQEIVDLGKQLEEAEAKAKPSPVEEVKRRGRKPRDLQPVQEPDQPPVMAEV